MIKALLATIAVSTAMVAGPATPAQADVSAACWAHLGGVDTANTPAADRRYHLERGEPSPCTEYDAQSSLVPNQTSSTKSEENHDDGKSRYCRKRWFC